MPKPKPKPKPSELQIATQAYNGIRWQLKGSAKIVQRLMHRVPEQGLLISPGATPWPEYPKQLKAKLCNALESAQNQLEYCEYLCKMLSQSHSEAYAHTQKLTKTKETQDD